MARVHRWEHSYAVGEEGAQQYIQWLEQQGRHVIDVTALKEAQQRDIDLIVDHNIYVEVKTDTHSPERIFLELSCNGKPGALFKSRADLWVYLFPRSGIGYVIPLASLQHFAAIHMFRYQQKQVTSRRKNNFWTVTGMVVPVADLEPIIEHVIDLRLEAA